jgi:hypothetical protein
LNDPIVRRIDTGGFQIEEHQRSREGDFHG